MRGDLITFHDRAYLRTGQCDGCIKSIPGACCRYLVLPERPVSADELAWLRLHPGAEAMYAEGKTGRVDIPCSALVEGMCSLYGLPERPQMCDRYPELPEQLIEGCAYALTEV